MRLDDSAKKSKGEIRAPVRDEEAVPAGEQDFRVLVLVRDGRRPSVGSPRSGAKWTENHRKTCESYVEHSRHRQRGPLKHTFFRPFPKLVLGSSRVDVRMSFSLEDIGNNGGIDADRNDSILIGKHSPRSSNRITFRK